ncbi:phospholipase A2 inhibitor 31 kDa subunit-like [Anomaloglossus baeobatrachus]|uniref:phospholipase A2 inhibitor 31 kDa subunit-like n=1 Tax=Anomaloglossus baeobatrachus TaxID=238106 RepID=UPI003F4F5AB1
MKNLVALLCMISALAGSVFSYKCHFCYSPNSTTCNQTEIECIGGKCMTACQFFCNGKNTYKSIYKGCANDTLCGSNGIVIPHKDVKYRFHLNCCSGPLCNTDKYNFPKEDPAPNGKICPSAFCRGTLEKCESHNKTINCTGSMDRCVEYRGKVRNPDKSVVDYSLQGCVNSDGCNNFDSAIGLEEQYRETLIC